MRMTPRFARALAALLTLTAPALAHADDDGPGTAAARFTADDFLRGWSGLQNGWYLADALVVLGLAAGLGAVLAYHPTVRRKAWSFEQHDQPKTVILYALVGALAALVGREEKSMAYVIFGIGGLMRFRTDVGEAKDTGRLLLATMVGVLVGLKLMPVALVATGFSWLLIAALERQRTEQVHVQGIDREHITAASEAYRAALVDAGCTVLGERKNVLKGTIQIMFRAPVELDRGTLDARFEQRIARELRGSVDWEVR